MGNYTIFSCSKILGEAGKQEILQQVFLLGDKIRNEQVIRPRAVVLFFAQRREKK